MGRETKDEKLAEEVGVEPTRRLNSGSTALKAARPTGDDALPSYIVSDRKAQSRATYSRHHFYLLYNQETHKQYRSDFDRVHSLIFRFPFDSSHSRNS